MLSRLVYIGLLITLLQGCSQRSIHQISPSTNSGPFAPVSLEEMRAVPSPNSFKNIVSPQLSDQSFIAQDDSVSAQSKFNQVSPKSDTESRIDQPLNCATKNKGKQLVDQESLRPIDAIDFVLRVSDLPIPFGCHPESADQDRNGGTVLYYKTILSDCELYQFYHSEMERLGWHEEYWMQGNNESLLMYCKPGRICSISIRTTKQKRKKGLLRQLIIFYGQKK